MATGFVRPGAKRLAKKLMKVCARADMNDAIEATAVLAVLFCKLAAKEDGIPFDEVLAELVSHAVDVVDDGTISIADRRGE